MTTSTLQTEWVPITYRELWDVPRIFSARWSGQLYLFDCQFDEVIEDYPDAYQVYLLPPLTDADYAGSWAGLRERAVKKVGEIPISDVQFDQTRRKAVREEVFLRLRLQSTPLAPELTDYRSLRQGAWDDDWLLSPLAGLAFIHPQKLGEMVQRLEGGVYRVALPGKVPVDVHPNEGSPGTESGPWPWGQVFEAAAARFINVNEPRVFSYGVGIELLTGKSRTGYTNVSSAGFAPLYRVWARGTWFQELLEQHAGSRLVVLGGADGAIRKPVHGWITPQRCYAVLGYDRAADRVRVRDPRGVDDAIPSDRKQADYGPGEFWLTAAETEDSFCGLSVEDQ